MRPILMRIRHCLAIFTLFVTLSPAAQAADRALSAAARDRFQPEDVFQLEFASDPQISPDGEHVVYVRNSMDIMTDRRRSKLWIVRFDGSEHRPLTTGEHDDTAPRWSPDGRRLLYLSRDDSSTQIFVRWMDTGQTARLSNVTESPGGIAWSPDGQWIAFSMHVAAEDKPFATMPREPDGAEWAAPPRVIDKLTYRRDGSGYVEGGASQLFVLPADGGTPRAVTSGDFDHSGAPTWTSDSRGLVFSSNEQDDWEYDPVESELYEVPIAGGAARRITDRDGPDSDPVVSPNGRMIAYVGFDDQRMSYDTTRLYVMDRDAAQVRLLSGELDQSVRQPSWDAESRGIYFLYDEHGVTKLAYVAASGGAAQTLATNAGGTSLGRPYGGGTYSVAKDGRFALTLTSPSPP